MKRQLIELVSRLWKVVVVICAHSGQGPDECFPTDDRFIFPSVSVISFPIPAGRHGYTFC